MQFYCSTYFLFRMCAGSYFGRRNGRNSSPRLGYWCCCGLLLIVLSFRAFFALGGYHFCVFVKLSLAAITKSSRCSFDLDALSKRVSALFSFHSGLEVLDVVQDGRQMRAENLKLSGSVKFVCRPI